jgi:hypothetical protein
MKKAIKYGNRKLIELKSVALFLDVENGELFQIGIYGNPLYDTRFNILDRDGRSYDYETFDKLINKEDSKIVISFLFSYIQKGKY